MASIRDLNQKIASLQNMKKIMRAMNMIASIKLSKLLAKHLALIKFTEALNRIRASLFLRISQSSSPIVTGNVDSRQVHIIIFTADRGLCGPHNNSIFREMEKLINRQSLTPEMFDVTSIGARGAKYCRKKEYSLYHSVDINEKTLQDSNILRISQNALNRFNNGEIGRVFMVFNRFVSPLTQKTETAEIIPIKIDVNPAEDSNGMTSDLADEMLVEEAAPLLIFYQLKTALSNSYLSENGARMTAMGNASNNSQDLINRYGALKNRARQTAITNELSEIVSGKEAMKK